jgi:ParB/RepB/Spo0J family partition protein
MAAERDGALRPEQALVREDSAQRRGKGVVVSMVTVSVKENSEASKVEKHTDGGPVADGKAEMEVDATGKTTGKHLNPERIMALIPFTKLVVDEKLNTRQVYESGRIDELAESIREVGLEDPLGVSFRKEDGKYDVLKGFRRIRALKKVYGPALMKMEVPCRILDVTSLEDKMMSNLISDHNEPIRSYDLAQRLHMLCVEMSVPQTRLSKRMGIDPTSVSNLIKCWKDLAPEIKTHWGKAPSKDQEIAKSLLIQWSTYPHEDQLVAFKQYLDPEAALQTDEEDEIDVEGDKPKKPKNPEVTHKIRGKKEIQVQLASIKAAKEDKAGKPLSPQELGAMEALRWVLNEKQTLRF